MSFLGRIYLLVKQEDPMDRGLVPEVYEGLKHEVVIMGWNAGRDGEKKL